MDAQKAINSRVIVDEARFFRREKEVEKACISVRGFFCPRRAPVKLLLRFYRMPLKKLHAAC